MTSSILHYVNTHRTFISFSYIVIKVIDYSKAIKLRVYSLSKNRCLIILIKNVKHHLYKSNRSNINNNKYDYTLQQDLKQ